MFVQESATTEIFTLSLHDALPISHHDGRAICLVGRCGVDDELRLVRFGVALGARGALRPEQFDFRLAGGRTCRGDRKSTRLNSSHVKISYAVFCLKKKNWMRQY